MLGIILLLHRRRNGSYLWPVLACGSFYVLILALGGCATFHPLDDLRSSEQFETVVLFSTGNIQGALLPARSNEGGAALLSSYFKDARSDFGNRVVWLDSGNLRGNSFDSSFDRGKAFEEFLQESNISLTLDGKHSAQATPEGAAPVAGSPTHELKELNPEHPSHVLISTGRIQTAVISGATADEVLQQAQSARNDGAQMVVWLTNLPIRCNPVVTHPLPAFKKPGDPNGFCQGVLYQILSTLTPGTVNAVIASGSDHPLEQFVYPRYSSDPFAGIPVVEATAFGKSAHLIYLTYDLKEKHAVPSKTRIEGPVQICAKIYKNQNDCDPTRDTPLQGRGSLVRARFHGRGVDPDSDVMKLAAQELQWLRSQEQQVLAQSTQVLTASPTSESSIGDLIADAMKEETHADFALVHPGLFKHAMGDNSLNAGAISWADLTRVLPADTGVSVIHVTGDELKIVVRVSETGVRGFSAVSGMKLRLIRPDRDAPATDLNGDHVLSDWELNRLIQVTDLEDEPLHTRRNYSLAIPTFLLQGGDDWRWLVDHFGLERRVDPKLQVSSARELLATYLKQRGKIEAINPRIRFEQPPGKHSRRVRHVRHRRKSGTKSSKLRQ